MKKIFLLLVAIFAMTTANAQFDFCIGPKLGYQTTKLSFKKDNIKSDFKGNMTLGVFGRITVERFVVQPELLYFKSSKSMRFETTGKSFSLNNIIVNQNNLALPVFLGYQFVDTKMFDMRICAAPVFYFAVGKVEYTSEDGNKSLIVNDASKNTIIGGAVNLGVDIWRFVLDVNYSFGLSKVFDDELHLSDNRSISVIDARQNVFTVTLGFKFL